MKVRSLILVLAVAPLFMANKGCDKQEAQVQGRTLKKRVELGKINSAAFDLPGGGHFDFQFVANAQMYEVIQETGHFTMPYLEPTPTLRQSKLKSYSKLDSSLLKKWMNKVSTPQIPEDVACLISMPQAYIGGSIKSFEMVGGGGLTIGFGPGGAFDVSRVPSASVLLSFAQLDVGLVAYSPVRKTVLATGSATAKQTKVDLNLTIDFGQFTLGPKFFFQSPLSKVTKKALTKAVEELSASLSAEPWKGRIHYNHDGLVLIEGGEDVGLMVGDTLDIYNENHFWEGEPCKSRYKGSTRSKTPVATIKVVSVGEALSEAEAISQTDWNPQPGDLLLVNTLVQIQSQLAATKP